MPDNKIVTLDNLTEFKTKCDEAYAEPLPSLTDNAGKVLTVNSGATGVEWGTVSGGTKLYNHELSFDDGNIKKDLCAYYQNQLLLHLLLCWSF